MPDNVVLRKFTWGLDLAGQSGSPNSLQGAGGMTGPKHANGETTWGGLAEEVRYWGKWVLEKVRAEVGDLYPPLADPQARAEAIGADPQQRMEFARDKQGRLSAPRGYLTPVAYLWTRTVICKNPSCGATVPLVKQSWLCRRPDRLVAAKMVPELNTKRVRFVLEHGRVPDDIRWNPDEGSEGGNVVCGHCGSVADAEYVQRQGVEQRVGTQLIAAVCSRKGSTGKIYLPAEALADVPASANGILDQRIAALAQALGTTILDEPISSLRPSPNARGLSAVTRHGMNCFRDLFMKRQLAVLFSFVQAIRDVRSTLGEPYGKLISTYCAVVLDKVLNRYSTFSPWDTTRETVVLAFGKHMLPMVWDFAESNPLEASSGGWPTALDDVLAVIDSSSMVPAPAHCYRSSATSLPDTLPVFDAIVTDPPYYDNIPYADISDFYYVWLRRTLGTVYPEHFASELTPKRAEATALSSRHGGDMVAAKEEYERFMLESFKQAHRVLSDVGQMVVVYAHKTTLGWSTLVDALRRAGFSVTEAWPLDTEYAGHRKAETASLASSILIVVRKREFDGSGNYEEDVQRELERIVRERVETLWEMGIAGADLVISAVGAGLRAFTKYARVEFANGEEMPAERFLTEVEGVVLDTILRRLSKEAGGNGGKMTLAGVDEPTRFYILWRYAYKAATLDAGEAIVFANGTHVELDGQKGLSAGARALVEKAKSKYRLRDFTERGDEEKLGQRTEDGKTASLIDALHRTLWLMENRPRELTRFLEEAHPDRERMRLVAQALAGTALKSSGATSDDGPAKAAIVGTTPAESAALGKLTANWRSLIEQPLAVGESGLFGSKAQNR